MADSEATAALRPGGAEVVVKVEIGDGVPGYWNVGLLTDGVLKRRWEGRSDDLLPDEVRLPRGALQPGHSSLTWSVVLYGPTKKVPYHVQVRVLQDGERALKRGARLNGELKPRKTLSLSGTIDLIEDKG